MSKFSNILRMLILLKSRGKMKAKEIAEILEVDERMIRRYREDLEMAGIYIESTPGTNGGYTLNGYDYLMDLNLNIEEVAALNLAAEQLKSINFIYSNELESILDKINIAISKKSENLNTAGFYVKGNLSVASADERKKCIDFNAAIVSGNKIRISYFSLTNGESERVIQPYAIFYYKGAYYISAFCEVRKEIRDFKISRIKEYGILDETYNIPKDFSLREYMKDSFGIYKDGSYNVKLKIEKPLSYIVSENVWVNNQKITWLEDESIIYEAIMEGKTEIVSWLLSLGSKVTILEPIELKDEVKSEVEKMIKLV